MACLNLQAQRGPFMAAVWTPPFRNHAHSIHIAVTATSQTFPQIQTKKKEHHHTLTPNSIVTVRIPLRSVEK